MPKIKQQIFLTPTQDKYLRNEAKTLEITISELIRRILHDYINK